MATTGDLVALGFTPSSVSAVTLNLPHPDPFGIGPFCRLRVQTTAPRRPGVYAWVVDGQVCYVGKAVKGFGLNQKVKGQSLGLVGPDLPPDLLAVQHRLDRRPGTCQVG